MTLNETRQLGIEFERRVLTMIPETEYLDKLDTETIYSFLNQYQDKYIEQIYRNLELVLGEGAHFPNINNILLSLLETITADVRPLNEHTDHLISKSHDSIIYRVTDTGRSISIEIPNMYMYVRSVSSVSKYYRFGKNLDRPINGTRIVPNKLVSQKDANDIIETPNDNLRILRNPIAILGSDGANKILTVIPDRYTVIDFIRIVYYKKPSWFSILANTPCELPSSSFDDLVTGAVDLYVNYVAGAEARKRLMQENTDRHNQDNKELLS